MQTRSIFVLCLLTLSTFIPSVTAENRPVEWVELRNPAAQSFQDPFRALKLEQLQALRNIADLKQQIQKRSIDKMKRRDLSAQLEAETAGLANEGVDAEALLAQREKITRLRRAAATEGNPELDGKLIELVGFTIPAHGKDGHSIFIVPERLACSHVPLPPPNQIVRIYSQRSELPVDYNLVVRIRGRIRLESSSTPVQLIDGQREIAATFAVELSDIETIGKSQNLVRSTFSANPFFAGAMDGKRARLKP